MFRSDKENGGGTAAWTVRKSGWTFADLGGVGKGAVSVAFAIEGAVSGDLADVPVAGHRLNGGDCEAEAREYRLSNFVSHCDSLGKL